MSISYDALDRIKSLKSRIKQMAQLSYADAVQQQKLAENELDKLKADLGQLDQDWSEAHGNDKLLVQEMMNWDRYRQALTGQATRQKSVVVQQEASTRLHQENLTKCHQDEQMWEHLLQRKQVEQGLQEKQAEQATLDEVATSRFNRG